MAKFYGAIGYAELVETSPGVYEEVITERTYSGDFLRNKRRLQSTDQLNDNINVANEISILSDPFAYQHFHEMRYVELWGARWKITDVDATQYPRLILNVGGVYNGPQATTA